MTAPLRRTIEAAVTFYRPAEGWFNQTLRGEVVMGAVDPDEPVGVNQRSSWSFLRRTAELMTRKAPALRDVTVIRQWAGMYDITPDHRPIVGPTSQLEGWWQAVGWSGRGMLLAPFLTELLAEHVVTGTAPEMLRSFLPDRFSADDASRGRPGRLLRALLVGSGCLGRLSGVVGTGLQRRARVVVGEDDLAAIAETGQPAQWSGLLDELVGGRQVPKDLLVEADEDPSDRLADRPPTLLRHAAAEAGAVASTSGPLRRMASAANPATIAIQPAATNAAA